MSAGLSDPEGPPSTEHQEPGISGKRVVPKSSAGGVVPSCNSTSRHRDGGS